MAEKVEKERLDVLLVQRGLAPGRDQAKAYIMAGNVYVDGMKEDKAGTKIPVTAEIEVRDAAKMCIRDRICGASMTKMWQEPFLRQRFL